MDLCIKRGDLDDPAVIDLIRFHMETNVAVTPVGSVHALDLSALRHPTIRFFAGYEHNRLLVIGAWKRHDDILGEVKSMRVVESERGRGLGKAILSHIEADAKVAGVKQLSIETGSFDYFEPARKLYRQAGYVECLPFADYELDPNSVFMTKLL